MLIIGEEIIKIIEEKQIKPKPRWQFVLRNYVIWIFSGVFIVFGSLTVSTILFIISDQDWDIYDYLGTNHLKQVFMSIPYFWIVFFVLVILLAYYSFVHTKHGYKQTISRVFLASIMGSVIFGTALYFLGINSEVHELFSREVPFYDRLVYCNQDIWSDPKRGLLGGKIEEIKDKNEFTLKDFQNNIWYVTGDNIEWNGVVAEPGMQVKLIGSCGTDNNFNGKSLQPW